MSEVVYPYDQDRSFSPEFRRRQTRDSRVCGITQTEMAW